MTCGDDKRFTDVSAPNHGGEAHSQQILTKIFLLELCLKSNTKI